MNKLWWEVPLWALGSLVYLAFAVHIVVNIVVDVILERTKKFLDLYAKAVVAKDKIRTIN